MAQRGAQASGSQAETPLHRSASRMAQHPRGPGTCSTASHTLTWGSPATGARVSGKHTCPQTGTPVSEPRGLRTAPKGHAAPLLGRPALLSTSSWFSGQLSSPCEGALSGMRPGSSSLHTHPPPPPPGTARLPHRAPPSGRSHRGPSSLQPTFLPRSSTLLGEHLMRGTRAVPSWGQLCLSGLLCIDPRSAG